MIILESLLQSFGIEIYKDNEVRNVVDVLEDLYLKISPEEYHRIVQEIASTEAKQGHIFDQARNRPYQ